MPETSLANRFADYANRLHFEDLPAVAVHEAKRRFIDSIATAVGAMSADAYAIARRCALRVASQPDAGLFGGGRSSPEWAAFVNGLLIRYLDYNDTYLSLEPAHPSDNLAPVLAVGDMLGCGGKDLIVAAVLAYEVQCRLCDAASLRQNGFDHVTYGAISSCLAACKLMGLDPAKTTHAVGIAGVCNTALRQTLRRRIEHVEGLRLRQRRSQRRFHRPARRGRNDRPRSHLRGRAGSYEAGHAHAVLPSGARR